MRRSQTWSVPALCVTTSKYSTLPQWTGTWGPSPCCWQAACAQLYWAPAFRRRATSERQSLPQRHFHLWSATIQLSSIALTKDCSSTCCCTTYHPFHIPHHPQVCALYVAVFLYVNIWDRWESRFDHMCAFIHRCRICSPLVVHRTAEGRPILAAQAMERCLPGWQARDRAPGIDVQG